MRFLPRANHTSLAVFLLGISSLFSGSTFFVIKELVQRVDPLLITAYRFLGAGLCLVVFTRVRRVSLAKGWLPGLVLGFFLTLFFVGQNVGLVFSRAATMSFLTGLFVVIVPLLNWFFWRQAPLRAEMVAVGLSLVGLWVLSGGVFAFGSGEWLGLAAAFTYALYVIYGDRYLRLQKLSALRLTTQTFLITGDLSLGLALFFGARVNPLNRLDGFYLLYLIALPSLGSFSILNYAQKYLEATVISLLLSLVTVSGAILAWLFGGEAITREGVFGGGILVVAVLLPLWIKFTKTE